jgi:hypothetical protein
MANGAWGGPRLGYPAPREDPTKLGIARKNGANWFYWIAGLSIINTALVMTESNVNFIIGLGITQVIDALMKQIGGQVVIFMGLLINLSIAGFFVLLGLRANQGRRWAFLLGMVLYALDGGIFLLVSDYLSFGFHVFALFFLFIGYKANEALRVLAAGAGSPTPIEP